MRRIVELQLQRLRKLQESYELAFGARPVKRCLQRRLRDPLSVFASQPAAGQ